MIFHSHRKNIDAFFLFYDQKQIRKVDTETEVKKNKADKKQTIIS